MPLLILNSRKKTIPLVEGGTTIDLSGYRVHTFIESALFTTTSEIEVEYLIVAGGGKGRYGGGGAGGYLKYVAEEDNNNSNILSLSSGSYSVQVGGAESNSIFSSLEAFAGGNGATAWHGSTSGGSGGGGGAWKGSSSISKKVASPGIEPQGKAGGEVTDVSNLYEHVGGGGGGALFDGQRGRQVWSGDGGDGVGTYIRGSLEYFSGGGGGEGSHSGKGGLGGGGDAAIKGLQNTGGGGGGGNSLGGSGIVIIRYSI